MTIGHTEQVSEPGLRPGMPGHGFPGPSHRAYCAARAKQHMVWAAAHAQFSHAPAASTEAWRNRAEGAGLFLWDHQPKLSNLVRLEVGLRFLELATVFSYRPKTICRAHLGPPEESKWRHSWVSSDCPMVRVVMATHWSWLRIQAPEGGQCLIKSG